MYTRQVPTLKAISFTTVHVFIGDHRRPLWALFSLLSPKGWGTYWRYALQLNNVNDCPACTRSETVVLTLLVLPRCLLFLNYCCAPRLALLSLVRAGNTGSGSAFVNRVVPSLPRCQEKRKATQLRAKMPALQPVLKMKVDELFFKWLSDPATQTQLKQYLELIKSGQAVGLANGVAEDKRSPFGENNNVASHRSHTGKKPAPISPPCSHPSTGALPSGSSSNPRVSGPSARTLRKSVSTKKVTCVWCFLQTCHTCMYFYVFSKLLSCPMKEVWAKIGMHFSYTFAWGVCVWLSNTSTQGATQSSFELRLCYVICKEEGALLLFCNSCLQSSSHGLGAYAMYKQKSADTLEADVHLRICKVCSVDIFEVGMKEVRLDRLLLFTQSWIDIVY